MKKILKIALCALMVVGLAACGGESTDAQKKVVDNFFAYLKEGDLDKVSTICTGDDANLGSFTTMAKSFEVYEDVDTYGQVFVDETKKFVKDVFGALVESYEVKSIEKDGDNYVATVNAKMRDLSSVSFDQSEFTTMAQDYVNDNKDELVKLYQSDKSAYLDKVFGYVAPKIYGAMMEKVKAVQPEDVTTKITLTKDGDNWKISKID